MPQAATMEVPTLFSPVFFSRQSMMRSSEAPSCTSLHQHRRRDMRCRHAVNCVCVCVCPVPHRTWQQAGDCRVQHPGRCRIGGSQLAKSGYNSQQQLLIPFNAVVSNLLQCRLLLQHSSAKARAERRQRQPVTIGMKLFSCSQELPCAPLLSWSRPGPQLHTGDAGR